METFDYFKYTIDCLSDFYEKDADKLKEYTDRTFHLLHEKYLQVLKKNTESYGIDGMFEVHTPKVDFNDILIYKLNMAIANEFGRRTGRETTQSTNFIRVNIVGSVQRMT